MTQLTVTVASIVVVALLAAYIRSVTHRSVTVPVTSPMGTEANLAGVSLIVVFDNNAYRDLTKGFPPRSVDTGVQQLVAAERGGGIQAFAQPLILMEIGARMAGDSVSESRARSALTAAALHCEMRVNGQALIASMPDPETIVCMAAFGQAPQGNRSLSEAIISFARHVETIRDGQLDRQARKLVRVLSKHVARTEAAFLDDMYRFVAKPLNPQIKSWADLVKRPDLAKPVLAFLNGVAAKDFFARALAAKSADLLGLKPTSADLDAASTSITASFGVALALYNEIIKRILIAGCRLTRNSRENWFWDLHLALCVGSGHSVFGHPLKLVTSDADVVNAAKSAGCAPLVQDLAAYKSSLGLP
jgi:hypothetical protein